MYLRADTKKNLIAISRRSQHADFKFAPQDGTGIARLIPHASQACIELVNKLLAYNPENRYLHAFSSQVETKILRIK
jgi:hypothetical protein